MDATLQIASIIVSILLIILIMLQVRGEGLSGLLGGEAGGLSRSRRGLEKTMFQVTVLLAVVFLSISLLSVVASS